MIDRSAEPRGDAPLTVVLMAKAVVPGRVKTRLTLGPGALSPKAAAKAYAAMFEATARRLRQHLRAEDDTPPRLVLAMDDPEVVPPWIDRQTAAQPHGWEVVPQGEGDLGDRLERVWRWAGGGPVVFFGCDSPDLPAAVLQTLGRRLREADALIGPVGDGGYWTLACGPGMETLIIDIDWGTAAVYDQTRAAARAAGLRLDDLPTWHDVDHPADLAELHRRLGSADAANDPALRSLRRDLDLLLHDPRDMTDTTAPTPAPADEAEIDFSDSTLLLVDDNEQNVELLQAYLEALPCRTLTAYDGQQAMDIIEDENQPTPDLVLLDVMMPRMSGFEVCQKLKEDPKTRTIPVMMVTALNELGDIERGVEAGTDDFLTKPVNKLELLTRVKSLLRVRHLKRELDRTEAYIEDLEKNRGS